MRQVGPAGDCLAAAIAGLIPAPDVEQGGGEGGQGDGEVRVVAGGFALSQADWAARLDNPDWQILLKVKTDGVSLVLPDLQDIRTLANPLKLRFRAEVALGRFDELTAPYASVMS